jgi:hypothetical protein
MNKFSTKNIEVGARYKNRLSPSVIYMGIGSFKNIISNIGIGNKGDLKKGTKKLVIIESEQECMLGVTVDSKNKLNSKWWNHFTKI